MKTPMTEMTIATQPLPKIEITGDDLVVIADNPAAMVAAQQHLCEDVARKVELARREEADAQELVNQLTAAQMGTGSADRQLARAKSRVEYLVKVLEALAAGYVLVPDMPAQTIAVRVKRAPRAQVVTSSFSDGSLAQANSQGLPAGEGFYASPDVPEDRYQETEEKDGKKSTTYVVESTGEWDTDIRLPAMFLKPTIVERTGKVMARKLFDEIAVTPGEGWKWTNAVRSFSKSGASRGDPLVIGRIVDRVTKRRLNFLVAWFIDTKEI